MEDKRDLPDLLHEEFGLFGVPGKIADHEASLRCRIEKRFFQQVNDDILHEKNFGCCYKINSYHSPLFLSKEETHLTLWAETWSLQHPA